jgi:hypothetical protein
MALQTAALLLNTKTYEEHLKLHAFLDKLPFDERVDVLGESTHIYPSGRRYIQEITINVDSVKQVKMTESGNMYGIIALDEQFEIETFTRNIHIDVLSEHSLVLNPPIYMNTIRPLEFSHKDGKHFELNGPWIISDRYGHWDDMDIAEDDYEDLSFDYEAIFSDSTPVYSESDDGLMHLPITIRIRSERIILWDCMYALDYFLKNNKIAWNDGEWDQMLV